MCKGYQGRNSPIQAHLASNVLVLTRCEIIILLEDTSCEVASHFKTYSGRTNVTQTQLKSYMSVLTRCDIMTLVTDASSEVAGISCRERPVTQQPHSDILESNVSMLTVCNIILLVADMGSEVGGTSCARKIRDATTPLRHI